MIARRSYLVSCAAVIAAIAAGGAARPAAAASSSGPAVRRIALLVGANDPPPGRRPLRFAHDDAEHLAEVLGRVGHFAADDLHVLLDPEPAALTREFESIARAVKESPSDVLFLFYYSGHSDGQAVFPHGERMALASLRELIDQVGARVRLGMLDTCRGGTWTQSKGLSKGPPLEAADLLPLNTEGTALVSSSSGFENAHEADAVRGSFFTHHFAAGLLGAADRSGDGNVTLQEAFEYTKERTIRDSARFAPTMQHPSFDLELRGRQDIVLTQVAASSSTLDVNETEGPLEVIQLSTGVTVLEVPPGRREFRLALPPGRYLVRKVEGGDVRAKEIDVVKDATVPIAEGELEATGSERLALKGDEPPLAPSDMTTLPGGFWELRFAAGATTTPRDYTNLNDSGYARYLTFSEPVLLFGVTDRLEWKLPFPAIAYRFGDPGRVELVAAGGITSAFYSSVTGVAGAIGGGAALRLWTTESQSVILQGGGGTLFATKNPDMSPSGDNFNIWTFGGSAGYTWNVHNVVSFCVAGAIGWTREMRHDPALPPRSKWPSVTFGSGGIGFHSLPLVRVHASRRLALDGYASWTIGPTGALSDQYLGGFTWNF